MLVGVCDFCPRASGFRLRDMHLDPPIVLPLYPRVPENDLPADEREREEIRGWRVAVNVRNPTLSVYLPEPAAAVGTGVIVCPGGGYSQLGLVEEGSQVAQWLTSLGVAAFVLKYRLPKPCRHPDQLHDLQRAIRMVREHASEWRIHPDRVGALGFSAGGHLVSMGTHGTPDCKPNFVILAYPVISFLKEDNGARIWRNLCGVDAAPELLRELSSDLHVNESSPPAFIFHSTDDTTVDVRHSIDYYLACLAHKVPCELHVFNTGGHGYAMGRPGTPESQWPALCEAWMEQRSLLSVAERATTAATNG